MDVKFAFFNGALKEEVYVKQSHDYIKKGEEKKVLKIKKTLYNLKQAPRTGMKGNKNHKNTNKLITKLI